MHRVIGASFIEWMSRNANGRIRLASASPSLLGSTPEFARPRHAMSHHASHHDSTAASGQWAWLDAGTALGLVVVDSNRPAFGAGTARGLLKKFAAAH